LESPGSVFEGLATLSILRPITRGWIPLYTLPWLSGPIPDVGVTIIKGYFRNPLLIFFLGVVAAIGSVWIIQSNGFYPIDECAHFLYSRFVLSALPVTVQTWHRPGRLWLFALPAQLGHRFTMFFSLGLFLCLLVVTYRIAVRMHIKHAAWIVILTGLQPILFDVSYACLAEAPAALLIALSYLYHLKGKPGWGLALASALFLFRFEMFLYAVMMFFVYLWKREWMILPLVLLGPLLWIGSSAIISGDVMTFFREWSRFSHLGKYVPGVSVTYYAQNLQNIFGFAQVLLFVTGVIFIVRAKKSADYGIPFCIIAMNIIINTLAGAEVFHWTGSIGELRYIAVVAPFVGIVSLYGLSEILDRVKPSWAKRALSVLVFGAIVFNCISTTHPRRWTDFDQFVITRTKALRSEYPDLTLLSSNCIVAYVMDVAPCGGPHYAKLETNALTKYPECLVLWDPYSSNPRFDQTEMTKERMLRDSTMVLLQGYSNSGAGYLVLGRNLPATMHKHVSLAPITQQH
jgi:hypothetical protein